MDKIKIDEILNKSKNRKETIKRILIGIIIIIPIITGFVIGENYRNRTTDAKLVDSREIIENKIEEKQNTIDELNNQIEELKKKQEELENKIEEVRISKINKKQTVTSRSGSTVRETVQTSSNVVTGNEKWIWANVSAYCSCTKCCGKTNGITASGAKATANHTIAAPSTYKFGTKIEIAGMGIYTVEDRGGAITGNKIDVYFNSHSEALQFGRRNLQIRVVE